MASTKVELHVNDEKKNEVEVEQITSVEIRGATGVATYRLDPMQDSVIKLVVVGTVAPDEGELPVATENVVGHFGKAEDVKSLKDREARMAKEAEEASNPPAEREHVGKATVSK